MIQEGPARWLGELLQAAIWGAHALGAAVWVGGALVLLLVVRPALRAGGARPGAGRGRGGGGDRLAGIERAVGARFQEVVEACALVLAVSGVVLAVVRLSSGAAGPVYAVLLGLKVLLALAMFALATELRWSGRRQGGAVAERGGVEGSRAGWPGRGALSRLTLVLGIVVVLLAVVLRRVFEAGLGP